MVSSFSTALSRDIFQVISSKVIQDDRIKSIDSDFNAREIIPHYFERSFVEFRFVFSEQVKVEQIGKSPELLKLSC